jgi:hypothetical protein
MQQLRGASLRLPRVPRWILCCASAELAGVVPRSASASNRSREPACFGHGTPAELRGAELPLLGQLGASQTFANCRAWSAGLAMAAALRLVHLVPAQRPQR